MLLEIGPWTEEFVRRLRDTFGPRVCLKTGGMPDVRRLLPADKPIFRGHPDGWQGKSGRSGGKMAVQTAFRKF